MKKAKLTPKQEATLLCYSYAQKGVVSTEFLDKIFNNLRVDNKNSDGISLSKILELIKLLELRKQKKINRHILRASVNNLVDIQNYAISKYTHKEVAYKYAKHDGEVNTSRVEIRQKFRRPKKVM